MNREEYRKRLYREYLSRGRPAREKLTRETIEKQFPFWDSVFGRHLPPSRSSAVIDIGCGSGGFVHYLRQVGYRNVLGIDISEEQVAIASALGIPGIFSGDLRDHLAARPSAYGVVIARDVIEHFSKEEGLDLLILIKEALGPAGVCLIQTVNAESPFSLRQRWDDLTHETVYTAHSLETALQLAGFRDAASFPVPPVFRYSLRSAVRSVLWKGIEGLWRSALLIESGDRGGILTSNLITVARK
jgi:2-polyprenyl-3-methyl-5-hydroxy-6-metoxy-1,4-benzoquinol methylase